MNNPVGQPKKLDNPVRYTILIEAKLLKWFRKRYGGTEDGNVIQDVIRELLEAHRLEVENELS